MQGSYQVWNICPFEEKERKIGTSTGGKKNIYILRKKLDYEVDDEKNTEERMTKAEERKN